MVVDENLQGHVTHARLPEGYMFDEGGKEEGFGGWMIVSEAILENHDPAGSGAMVVVGKRREGQKKIKRLSTSFGPFSKAASMIHVDLFVGV